MAQLAQTLDPGESEALALAIERSADAVLVDERVGRLEADRLGFQVIGTLGLLVRAKQRSLIPEVAPLIERLVNELNFFVSIRLRDKILKMAGET